jgi:hypothetical protein
MLNLKLGWEMEDGSTFQEWALPIELSMAERELYNGRSLTKVIRDDESASNHLLLWLAHKIHKRKTDKPIGTFDEWAKKVVKCGIEDFDVPKVPTPEA